MSVLVVIRNEGEAVRLRGFGVRMAEGVEGGLGVIVALEEGEGGLREVEEGDEGWIAGLRGGGIERVRVVTGPRRRREILDAVEAEKPSLVIVGKHQSGRKFSSSDLALSRSLFEKIPGRVMVVRLGEAGVGEGKVLVPCAGGRHSRRALRLAHAVAAEETVAFHVIADADEVSYEVGMDVLQKSVRRAGLDPDELTLRVVLGDDFGESLREEVESGEYAMLVVGASEAGALRSKLFGTVPDRLMQGEDSMSCAVVRAEKTTGRRWRESLGRLVRLHVPQLRREERIELFEEIETKSMWNFDFASLMVLATLIASMGLLVNSGAVVIGAMLVAPLMMPLLGTGLALAQGNWPLCGRSLGAVVRGFLLALLIGMAMGLLARVFYLPVTDQLRMRGEPNLLDLGVAFVSGIAAAYCLARPKLSGALAGVAIAAALVPPIATAGIGLSLGETSLATGAAFLFGINVVAVVLGAGLNFALAGIRGRGKAGEWSRRGLIVLMLCCAGVTVPLGSVLFTKLSQPAALNAAVEECLSGDMKLRSVRRIEEKFYEVTVASPVVLDVKMKEAIEEKIAGKTGRGVKVRLRTVLVVE